MKRCDLITMTGARRLPHIAIVSATQNDMGDLPLLIHNIGPGSRREDILERYPITGRYRFRLV
jgi:hypothetical protein